MSQTGPNLKQLEEELAAAGVTITRGLGYTETDNVFTYNENGEPSGLPDGSDAVVEAHDPQPIVDPRIAVIEGMDVSSGDKTKLKDLIIG